MRTISPSLITYVLTKFAKPGAMLLSKPKMNLRLIWILNTLIKMRRRKAVRLKQTHFWASMRKPNKKVKVMKIDVVDIKEVEVADSTRKKTVMIRLRSKTARASILTTTSVISI